MLRCPRYFPSSSDVLKNNPATHSALLARLFPPDVRGAELRIAADLSLLWPDELKYLGLAAPKRVAEFTAGRLCARRALAEFRITHYPLQVNRDKRPRWPASLTGSITHTDGFCGAVVAERKKFRSIGLDMDIVKRVTPDIWPYICTTEEMATLATLPEAEQQRRAALIFSAKECFFKCQYGVTKQWLEFQDVRLDFGSSGWSAGCFALRPKREIAYSKHDSMPFSGRFEFHGNFIATGMALPA